ncbi:MAG: HAD-IIA family hydrolase [Actinomycetota bacterium]|nr:HAD-IIA family hydrolase [Actinomycetota bacterium]
MTEQAGAAVPPTPGRAAGVRLCDSYDVALLDLDGVVYVGTAPAPGAAAALSMARQSGLRLAFVTNNASRSAAQVVELLAAVGVPAGPADVITSAQAAAHLLRERLASGALVLVVGTDALAEEVRRAGLRATRTADPLPAAVVQGYGPETSWRDLAEAAIAVRAGALWVATNTDSTLPSPRGPLPGNGALVAAVQVATGGRPTVVGKPFPWLHRESVVRSGARRPLVVGDRLDTDIQGAVAADTDSLLVLTGLTTPLMLLGAEPHQRPTYISRDLAGLIDEHPAVTFDGQVAACRGFSARLDAGAVVLSGGEDGDPIDALRALCQACWRAAGPESVVRAAGTAAAEALAGLGIAGQITAASGA